MMNLWRDYSCGSLRSQLRKYSRQHCGKATAKTFHLPLTRAQENVTHFPVGISWFTCFKSLKNVKLTGVVSTVDQEAAEDYFKITVKCYTEKGLCGRAGFNAEQTGLLYKDLGKQAHIMQVAFQIPASITRRQCN